MRQPKILIVEDEAVVAEDLRSGLSHMGYDVVGLAYTGEAGIDKAGDLRPDVVLMDIKLNGSMDGIEAAQQIRGRHHLPVIYLTAYADDDTLNRAKMTEPLGYIIKPFEERELRTAIEMALHKHKVEKQIRDGHDRLEEKVLERTQELRKFNRELQKEIEERKQIERRLQASEEHFRRLIENLSDMITILDREGTIEYFSPSVERILGYTSEELKGDNALSLIHRDDLKFLQERFSYVTENPGKIQIAWFRIRHKDGSWRTLESTAKTLSDTSPDEGIVLTSRDITERKIAEEELHKNQVMLLEAQRIANLGSWEWDIVSDKVNWSDELYRIYGLQPQEIEVTYEMFLEHVHPDDRTYVKKVVETALETRQPFDFYHRIILRDGEERILRGGGEVVFNEAGEPAKMFGVAHDVTEEKRQEQELRLLLNITRATVNAKDHVVALQKAIKIICDVTGWEYGEAWIPTIDGDYLQFCCAHFNDDRFEEFKEASGKVPFGKKAGITGGVWVTKKPRWIKDVSELKEQDFLRGRLAKKLGLRSAMSVPIPIRINDIEEVLAVLNFLTFEAREKDDRLFRLVTAVAAQIGNTIQRKRAEKALVESEERYRGLIESSPDAILVEQEGELVYLNPAALHLLGYDTLEELHGAELKDLLHPNDREDAVRTLAGVKDSPIPIQDARIECKDGRIIDVEVLLRRSDFEDEPAILAIVRDITETKRLKQEKERLQRLSTLGEFSASIAHEIRNPLGAIGLNCGMLSKEEIESHLVRKKIADIGAAANRIEQIIEDTLSFARPSTPKRKQINIHMLLDNALDMLREKLEHSDIVINKEYNSEKGDVCVDSGQIAQAIINLCTNAIEAMDSEGRLTLGTHLNNSEIVVTIADTGPGIPADDLRHIFEPFFTTKEGGTGLGMSIVSRILERNEVPISVDSEVGVGTTFTLRFKAT